MSEIYFIFLHSIQWLFSVRDVEIVWLQIIDARNWGEIYAIKFVN